MKSLREQRYENTQQGDDAERRQVPPVILVKRERRMKQEDAGGNRREQCGPETGRKPAGLGAERNGREEDH